MRFIGQDSNGRLILDMEGEALNVSIPIPQENPIGLIVRGVFKGTPDMRVFCGDILPILPVKAPLEDEQKYTGFCSCCFEKECVTK